MNPQDTLAALTPELVERFRTAIETGKWPNGIALTPEQRKTCLQAVLLWEHQHLPPEQRTGYIDRGSKQKDKQCDSHNPQDDGIRPIRFH